MVDASFSNVNRAYQRAFEGLLGNVRNEGVLELAGDLAAYEAEAENGSKLFCAVDTEHVIRGARYANAPDSVQQALLEGLCGIIVGIPIQECNDHGVIRLEHELRDRTVPAPVAGVVTPLSADQAFGPVLALCRDLYRQYLDRTGHDFGKNFYMPPPKSQWDRLNAGEKEKKITAALGKILQRHGIAGAEVDFVGLIDGKRIIVDIADSVSDANVVLMRLETELRVELDHVLEIFLQNKGDANKLRHGKLED